MAASNIVVVESPAKAKTINKYLGNTYKVLASYGHVRDLAEEDGSVKPDDDFAMSWEISDKASKPINEITNAVKGAKKLILATDPDREGEAISWHLLEVLKNKKALKDVHVERVVFNAITKSAVTEAMANPRAIDQELVDAYMARRALDYLVGFNLSPVLWRKLPGSRSAGRVQSVALRIICEREIEIEKFKPQEYWTVDTLVHTPRNDAITARLVKLNGEKLDKFSLANEAAAMDARRAIEAGKFAVTSVESKPARRNPYPPFTTSTLQQEAARKLGFSASHTMRVAQRLYEGVDIGGETVGLITYMRTDGVQIVPEAVSQIRDVISAEWGRNYTPFAREWKTKAKNAQEAHEAIRPTDPRRKPDQVRRHLDKDQAALYELIWKRTIASQMAPADLEQTSVDISVTGRDGKDYGLRANGSVITFDGFLKVYDEGRDDRVRTIEKGKDDREAHTSDEADDTRRLPPLAQGDQVRDKAIEPEQHFTQPPPRYSEATLVKRLEELGIGRPSTFASTLAVLQERDYVKTDKKRLVPEDKGRLVTAFLKGFFKRYVEYDFTADLEEKLDLISDGKLEWKDVLREFWKQFMGAVEETKELRVTDVLEALNEQLGPHIFPDKGDGGDPRACPTCGAGRLSLKTGKFGAFIGCSNYPECRYTRQLVVPEGEDASATPPEGRNLGKDPATGLDVLQKTGRFGPYLQLGEAVEGEKPKRSTIPKGFDPATIDLEQALKLLNLPRRVGEHPETGKPIVAGLGRYGPFIEHDGTYANLASAQELFEIGLNRAVTLIAEKKEGKGRGRPQAEVLKALGDHPSEGGKIEVLSGRYGPYIKHGKVNATLPKGVEPKDVTVEQAVQLIAERAAKGPPAKKGRFGKAKAAKDDGAAKPAKAKAKPKKAKVTADED